jgi:hypothetical protein
MKVDTANAISDVGRTILESAKVEMSYMKMVGADQSHSPLLVAEPTQKQLGNDHRADAHNAAKAIAAQYGKAQGVYYELKDGEVDPISLERISEVIGASALKVVPQYMSFSELKKAMIVKA